MCFRRTGPYNPRHVEHILNRFVGNEFTFSLHAYKMQIMFIILKHIYHERLQVSKTTSVTKQTQAPHRIGIALMNCYRNGNRCFFRENKKGGREKEESMKLKSGHRYILAYSLAPFLVRFKLCHLFRHRNCSCDQDEAIITNRPV